MSTTLINRGRVAALTRSRPASDPDLQEARRDLAASKLADYINRVISQAPPLTNEQRERLSALLAPVGGGAR